MKTMQRVWWLFLGICITIFGAIVAVAEPDHRMTGIIATVGGIAISATMGFILFGQKPQE